MRGPYTQLYLHLVWATWDRLPLITETVESRLYAAIAEKCRKLKCVPLAIGGIDDHIHLLVRLHTTVAIATLVKEVKGSSSHLVTHEITPSRQGSSSNGRDRTGRLPYGRKRFPKWRLTSRDKKNIIRQVLFGIFGNRPQFRMRKRRPANDPFLSLPL